MSGYEGSGTQRQDQRDMRDADNEQAYIAFEEGYFFENLRPDNIDEVFWRLMWIPISLTYRFSDRSEVTKEAKKMAAILGVSVNIESNESTCWEGITRKTYEPVPCDYYGSLDGKSGSRYVLARIKFIEDMVVRGEYPDLVKIAADQNHRDRHAISSHELEIGSKHRWILKKAAGEA